MILNFKKIGNYTYRCEEKPSLVLRMHSSIAGIVSRFFDTGGEPFGDYECIFNSSLFCVYSNSIQIIQSGLTWSQTGITNILQNFVDSCKNYPRFSLFYDLNNPVFISSMLAVQLNGLQPESFVLDSDSNFDAVFFDRVYIYSDEFLTNLYPELLDNSEQFQMAKSFLNDTDPEKELDPTYWTDAQLKFFDFVEKYNKNVLLLRSTRKVDASVSGSISQSGQSDIDLSPVVQQLSNLNNKLQRVDENQEIKNITQTINDLSLSNQTVITTVESAPYNPLLDDGSDIDF